MNSSLLSLVKNKQTWEHFCGVFSFDAEHAPRYLLIDQTNDVDWVYSGSDFY